MRLQWTANWNEIGNAFGYSNHQRSLRAALETEGVEITDDADIAVHIVVPTGFYPVPGKRQVLYTMYEGATIPEPWIEPIQRADLIVVPCSHNARLFRRYTDRPIEVCLEGVDAEAFAYKERRKPLAGDFTYLWVGASNPRKGFEHLGQAWAVFRHKYRDAWSQSRLIFLTSRTDKAEQLIAHARERFFIDTRVYSVENLVQMYHFAHAFVFPTLGEGFGLTLAEAMSTGLPCIYTPWSGPKDFISEREGYPLKFSMMEIHTVQAGDDGKLTPYHTMPGANPDTDHLARRMAQVFYGYGDALARGKRAAERVRRELTWRHSALRFKEIITKHFPEAA